MHDPKWSTRDEDDAKSAEIKSLNASAIKETDVISQTENDSNLRLKEWTDDDVLKKFNRYTIDDKETKFWNQKLEEKLDCKFSNENENEIAKSLV